MTVQQLSEKLGVPAYRMHKDAAGEAQKDILGTAGKEKKGGKPYVKTYCQPSWADRTSVNPRCSTSDRAAPFHRGGHAGRDA